MVLILQIYRIYEKKGWEESLAFLRKKKNGKEHTKGGIGTMSSIVTRHLLFGGTATEGPCRIGTSSSTMCMHFTLGTSSSSSPMCAMPNSSFIVSNIICKNAIYPNSLILERGLGVFEKKKKGKELTNWHDGTYPSRRRWRRKLDSPDEAMARV
jgi:hypothetical protein